MFVFFVESMTLHNQETEMSSGLEVLVDPALFFKNIPGKVDMLFLKHPFTAVPIVGFADCPVYAVGSFAVCDPVDG